MLDENKIKEEAERYALKKYPCQTIHAGDFSQDVNFSRRVTHKEAFTAGANFASEQYQEEIKLKDEWVKHHKDCIEESRKVRAKQEEEIKRLREDMKTLWLNSRANYISKDQAMLVKQLRIKYGLD